METICEKDDGYRGIWYSCAMETHGYSGGLGTYCAKHRPLAVYCESVRKTFFCYGGTTKESLTNLLHMVSYYDHERDVVPRPTILLDKETSDAHDNPTISVDDNGHIWVFSNAHGDVPPAYVHRSTRPYDVDSFERVRITGLVDGCEQEITNFSYMQPWHIPGKGFYLFHTRYKNPAARSLWFARSRDGVHWEGWHNRAAVANGHYEISAADANRGITALNFHPSLSPFIRTNLYYMETHDLGETWRTADGRLLDLPLSEEHNPALVYDYHAEGLLVYLKDILFDLDGQPVILFLTSAGNARGPGSVPRRWTTARWTGQEWLIRPAMGSGDNYDTGSLHIEEDGVWRLIAPTDDGPQPDNTGGEMVMWTSEDQGGTWTRAREMTRGSVRNHTYARRPVNAHPEFYALWADGRGGIEPSVSRIYFCDRDGNVRVLPEKMESDFAEPSVAPG
jgi:hypothetical protein